MVAFNTQIAHTPVSVGTSSVEAVPLNRERHYLLIQNDSASIIYISFGVPAELNKGIRLDANGMSFEMSQRNANVDIRAIFAISTAPNQNLLVTWA